jgi:NodT family efflux transporter outer membrane factor (OMF) lipoprotein
MPFRTTKPFRLRPLYLAFRPWLALVSVAMTAGCMVGPDFRTPSAPTTDTYTASPMPEQTVAAPVAGGAAQHFDPGKDLPGEWWALFQSPPLDQLIRQAIADNPTLAAASATLRQAQENYLAKTGQLLYPAVSGNLGATREKFSNAQIGEPGASIFNLYNASVNVAYTVDVFGGSRRQLEASQAQVDYQGYQLQAAYLTLTSNIVTAAIREASLRGQIAATKEIIDAYQQQLDLVQKQFQLGGASKVDVLGQQTQVAQLRATLPPLERDLEQTRHLISVLAGAFPSTPGMPSFELTTIKLPVELPVSLPSSLVRQRPDILAAEAQLHTASAQVGVATANLYPQITLNGSFGSQSNLLRDLFSGPALWSIGAGLLQPIFNGGQLNAERRAAIAAYDASAAQYRATVLQAFQSVADVLRAIEEDARTLTEQAQAEAYANATLDLTQKQYRLGAVNYLTLLIAQRAYTQTRINLVQAQAARYADTAALFQALGGGWWNRPESSAVGLAEPSQ